MDEELIIVQSQEENYDEVAVEELELDIEQSETVEYIEVGEPEEEIIEISEAFPASGDGASGNYAPLQHEHPIAEINELSDVLHNLASTKDYYSAHSGLAEFRPWLEGGYYDENYTATGGVGYFVSLITGTGNLDGNNIYIDICRKKNDDGTVEVIDVYGVTVSDSGFYGYQDVRYDSLDSTSTNRANDPNYAKVCLLGNVKVRVSAEDHLNINVGDHVVPNELGYAQKSENDVGFKVISKGQIQSVGSSSTAWYYVDIALVPQNDNVARVMKKIEDTQVDLENITIQLGDMSDKVTDMESSNIQLGEDFKGLQDLVNESTDRINTQLPEMEQMLQEAKDIANEADEAITKVQTEYAEAVSKSNEALKKVDDALGDVADLQKNIEPLATWKSSDGATFGTAGFIAQAEKDHTELSTLTQAFGENGTDLTAIIQKIDSNGAAIQHIVSHIDKYTLGAHSPAYGLSSDEVYILQPGHIYVPTEDHNDEDTYVETPIDFKLGKYYEWAIGDVPEVYTWVERGDVSTATSVIDGTAEGDLWYCWQGVFKDDKYLYDPGVLYYWDNTKKIWVAVASVNDNSTARVTGLIRQTADELMSVYTDLEGNVSDIRQTVSGIETRVATAEGDISQIHQTAEDITLGVYDPEEGSTSLGILLNGMQSMSNYGGRVCIKHVVDSSPITANRYAQSPMWNGEKFVFAEGALDEDGIYYPYPNDNTKYCKIVSDGYEVYTIGNEATALLRTDVDNNKSAIEALVKFDTETEHNLATIQAQVTANESKIASVAAGEYVVCSDINLDPTEEELTQIPTTRYTSVPTWSDDGFVFDTSKTDANGVYYMIDGETSYYYKLLFDSNGDIAGYEQYELASSGSASIMQVVTEQGSSIGMIVENNEIKGAVLVEAINGQSTATISADKINLISYAKLTDVDTAKKEAIEEADTNAKDYTDDQLTNYTNTTEMKALISQTAEGINLEVSETYETIANVNTKVDGAISTANQYTNNQLVDYAKTSEITQLSDKISIVVSETENGNVVNVARIVSEINNGSSKISMSAVDIDLTGYVTFNSLEEEGQTTINGNNIKTGAIKSVNYVAPTDKSVLAQSGTKIDLTNGTITSKSFSIDEDGNITMNGGIDMQGSIALGGKDSTVRWYDEDNNTFISGKYIYSPSIEGGTITGGIFYSTGIGDENSVTSAYYILNGSDLKGYISYDNKGIGGTDGAKERMFITSVNGVVLKLHSSANMSLSAGDDYKSNIYTKCQSMYFDNLKCSKLGYYQVGEIEGTVVIDGISYPQGLVPLEEEDEPNSPDIFANSYKLATQEWVKTNYSDIDLSNLKITFG